MTEIAPGMMVECIDDSKGPFQQTGETLIKGKHYLIIKFHSNPVCGKCYNCRRIDINNKGWCQSRFRPIGGDKEIERELFETNPPKNKKIKNLIELASRPLKIYHCE